RARSTKASSATASSPPTSRCFPSTSRRSRAGRGRTGSAPSASRTSRRCARFVAAGAEALGPVARGAEGALAVLRDPFGALVGLAPPREPPAASKVAWRVLHARERAPAVALYASLCGW